MRVDQIHYVALGDSTARGYGGVHGGYPAHLCRRLNAEGFATRLTNFGVDGAKTSDVRAGQLSRAISSRPDLVTVGIGINDLTWGRGVDRFRRELDEILDRLCATGAQVVVSEFPDLSLAPIAVALGDVSGHRERLASFNAAIASAAREHGAALAEVFPKSQELLPTHPEFFSMDGFHPSDDGYAAWAEMMWPAVLAAAGRIVAAWAREPVAGPG